jgi:hypothetical protein
MSRFDIAVILAYAAVIIALVVAVITFLWNLVAHRDITRLIDIGILALAFVVLSIYVDDMKNDDKV